MLEHASWVGLHWPAPDVERPVILLRRAFELREPVTEVVLEATALGVLRVFLDGVDMSRGRLDPGWSDYRRTVRVQRVEVPAGLSVGQHVLAVELAEGWWSGHVGYHRVRHLYGDRPWARVQLSGRRGTGAPWALGTSDDWRADFGEIRGSDLHDGETVDLRLTQSGWNRVGFDGDTWDFAEVGDPTTASLVIDRAPPVRVVREEPSVVVTEPLPGVQIVDVGRNLAGHVRIRLHGEAGQQVALRHAEALEEDGTLYRANLREARQTDRITLAGGEVNWEPKFTTHGFRYVEVTGLRARLRPEDVTTCVVRTDLERVGWFECSDTRVNRLHQLLTWSIESNSIAIPTDCPQRDERLGWLEDVAALVPTRAFLFDHYAWLSQWLDDVRAAQGDDGWLPDVAPLAGSPKNPLDQGAPGWADAGVQVPWMLHRWYGDETVVRDNLDMAARFVHAVADANPDGRWSNRRGADYGDWLGFLPASKDLVAQAHAARSARCLAEMAALVGDADLAAWARHWDERVRARFVEDHLDADGHVGNLTQSAIGLAMAFDLVPEGSMRRIATDDLVASVREHENAVTCGYLALPHLLHVLTDRDRSDVAWDLVMGEQMPGWMHLVDNGATSLWERWDGWDHDTGLNQAWLNSLNHASLGVVGDWLHASVGGLAPAAPGWSRVRIAPRPGGGVTSASARHVTKFGEVAVEWEATANHATVHAAIPAGMVAEIVSPTGQVGEHEGPADVTSTWDLNT